MQLGINVQNNNKLVNQYENNSLKLTQIQILGISGVSCYTWDSFLKSFGWGALEMGKVPEKSCLLFWLLKYSWWIETWRRLHIQGAVMDTLCLFGMKLIFWLSWPLPVLPFPASDAAYANRKPNETTQSHMCTWRLNHTTICFVRRSHGAILCSQFLRILSRDWKKH